MKKKNLSTSKKHSKARIENIDENGVFVDDNCLFRFLLDWNASQFDCYSSATQRSIYEVKKIKKILISQNFAFLSLKILI